MTRINQVLQYEEQPVTTLYRVGTALAGKLEKLGISSIKDLLLHLPYRYEDRTKILPIDGVSIGLPALVVGQVIDVKVTFARRRNLITTFDDGSGEMVMRLFHFSVSQQRDLQPGKWLRCYGEVRRGSSGLEMIHPHYSVLSHKPTASDDATLTPIYPLTEGLTQNNLKNIIKTAIDNSKGKIPELLPQSELNRLHLPDINVAIEFVHAPPVDALHGEDNRDIPAMRRLIYEELLSNHVARRWMKKRRQDFTAPVMEPAGDLSSRLRKSLKFEPTNSQRSVIREIIQDLRNQSPMLRLVQGDVGSGKTLVAAAAAAWAVDSGYQFVIMAPTELLAEQHLKSFVDWFSPLGIDVLLLTSSLKAKERRLTQTAIETGNANIVVGTHALFQENVKFKKLGLIVVDEQHRFGVDQRFALREKGVVETQVPHQLIMTATPIPRSLAMTYYADLDVSSITEMPPNRIPPMTKLVSAQRRREVIERVRRACRNGAQAYWVCPFIEKSEHYNIEAAVETEKLINSAMPDLRVGLVHGRVKGTQRDRIMNQFRKRQIDVLVATTVIEVGVDVPNATMMVIENSERLGLAQLHQLRGRVGRGASQAQCILMFQGRLGKVAKERLKVMIDTTDGFKIAETDMQIRGAGDILGTRQTGVKMFRIAEFPRDVDMIQDVRETAQLILNRHSNLIRPLIRRWMPNYGNYGDV